MYKTVFFIDSVGPPLVPVAGWACLAQLLSALGLLLVASSRQDGEAQQRLAERPLPQEVAEEGPDMVRPGEGLRAKQLP